MSIKIIPSYQKNNGNLKEYQVRMIWKVFTCGILAGSVSLPVAAAGNIKYAAIAKEDDKWKVLSIGENLPVYKEGMEIVALPRFVPAMDKQLDRSGGFECPDSDKSVYSPCNSFFFRFTNANWFGLGGYRVTFRPERQKELKNAISGDEIFMAWQAKEDEAAAAGALAAREAERQRNAKQQEEARLAVEARNSLVAGNLEKMAKMERGMEDSCKRNLKYVAGPGGSWGVNAKDPDRAEIKCQFGGDVTLQGLAETGWLVVNKIKDNDGLVTEYYVRKAR